MIAADYEKTCQRYGRRGERYAVLEAGHAAQNVALVAVELGLDTVMVGAFDDSEVRDIMYLDQEAPLYIIPIGRKFVTERTSNGNP